MLLLTRNPNVKALSDFSEKDRIAVPTVRLSGRLELAELLADTKTFATLVIDGMVLRQLRIGEQPTLRVFGPGEIVATGAAPSSMLLAESDCRVVDPSGLAVFPRRQNCRSARRPAPRVRRRTHHEHLHPATRLAMDDGNGQRHARSRRTNRR